MVLDILALQNEERRADHGRQEKPMRSNRHRPAQPGNRCTPEGVGNNLLELEHELEALTAQQNALLDQALANMEDLTIAEQLKTLLEEKQHLQTRIDATKKEAANRINEDSRMAEYATYLEEHLNGFPHYDDEVVRKMIERVTVVDSEIIRVKFRYSDLEIEQSVC